MINIIKGNDLINDIFDYEVILFSMGINNSMGNNFSYEIGLNFPQVKENENLSKYGDKKKLGTINETIVDDVIFCACYINNGGYKKDKDGKFIKYEDLRSCLKLINNKYKNKSIACPIIGSYKYDGNGDKDEIIKMFDQECCNCRIFLYDYNTDPYSERIFREIAALHQKLVDKKIDGNEFIKERGRIEWKRKMGIYKEMPENYIYIPRQNKKKIRFIGKIEKK